MAHLKSALSQDDPFLASLSTVQATEKATATSAGFQTVDEYRKGLAWYQSIRTSPKVASFGGATTNQLLSHVTSNPHIFKWPASGSLFEVTLTGKGKHTARESGTTNTGEYDSGTSTAYRPLLLYADWHTRELDAKREAESGKAQQLRSFVSTVPGLSSIIQKEANAGRKKA